jgi:hypothetical protein
VPRFLVAAAAFGTNAEDFSASQGSGTPPTLRLRARLQRGHGTGAAELAELIEECYLSFC